MERVGHQIRIAKWNKIIAPLCAQFCSQYPTVAGHFCFNCRSRQEPRQLDICDTCMQTDFLVPDTPTIRKAYETMRERFGRAPSNDA